MEKNKVSYYIPIKGNSNYDMCMCAAQCKKKCIRNLTIVKPCERYYCMSDFTNTCVDFKKSSQV